MPSYFLIVHILCSYINKSLQPLHPPSTAGFNQQKNFGDDSDKHLSQPVQVPVPGYNSDITSPTLSTQRSVVSLATTSPSGRVEIPLSGPQQRAFPAPVPVRGVVRFDGLCTGYNSAVPPVFCTQSGQLTMPSPSSYGQHELPFRANPCHTSRHETSDSQLLPCNPPEQQKANNSTSQANDKPEQKLESLEGQGRFSPSTDQNSSCSFGNGGGASHLNSFGCGSICGSNGNANPVSVVQTVGEGSKTEDGVFSLEGHSQRSIQREAALTKFRLKRKDRCYDKKVCLLLPVFVNSSKFYIF